MKKTAFLIFALACSVFACNAALTALHIHTTSHGIITLMLDEEPELTFNDDRSITVEVKSNPEAEPVSISFDEVETCQYGDKDDYDDSGIDAATSNEGITVKIGTDAVVITGLTAGIAVEVYDISGMRVTGATAAEGNFTLRRDSLGNGVYIIRAGSFVTKLSL